jgi:large subunit ribosomal protein L21
MYAIIQDRGRQYRVSEGDRIQVDYLNAAKGERVEFDRVLAVGGTKEPHIGKPMVEGALVVAEVLAQQIGPKIRVQRFRRRKGLRRLRGHRQLHTEIQVREIRFPGKAAGTRKKAAKKSDAATE